MSKRGLDKEGIDGMSEIIMDEVTSAAELTQLRSSRYVCYPVSQRPILHAFSFVDPTIYTYVRLCDHVCIDDINRSNTAYKQKD